MTGIIKTDQIQGAGSSTVTIPTGNTLNVADNLTVDTNTLHVDASNNKVGIGTTSPEETLEVVHATAPAIQLNRTNDGGFKSILRQQGNDFEIRGSSGSTKIYTGNADGDSSTARLIIDASGHVTMPSQSAFHAGLNGSSYNNLTAGADLTVVFDLERFDQNGDYNTSTGVFTAPVTGRYFLCCSLYGRSLDTAATYYQIKLETSNRTYVTIIEPKFSSDVAYLTLRAPTIIADMDASDTAKIVVRQTNGSDQFDITNNPGYTNFSGYLVA
jgi:hypothetical protein